MSIWTNLSARTRAVLGGTTWLLLAALTLWAFRVVFATAIIPFHLFRLYSGADWHVGATESLFYILFASLGGLAAWFLFKAFSSLDGNGRANRNGLGATSRVGRLVLPMAVLTAVVGAFLIAQFVHDYAWFTDDEQAYLLQARLLSDFQLSEPVARPSDAFTNPFIQEIGKRQGVEHWTGIYPVLHPAMMALAGWVWRPHLWQFLCLGLLVFHAGKLGAELFSSRQVGWIAAWLCALSPMLVGLSSTLHSALPGVMLSVVAARLLWSTLHRGGVWRSAALGCVAGAVVLVRSMDGILVVGVCGLLLLARVVRSPEEQRREAAKSLLAFIAGGLAPAAVFVWTNMALTGHPLRGGYWLLGQERGRLFGFGEGGLFDREFTPQMAVTQTMTTILRLNFWAFAWPVSLLPWVIALTTRLRNKTVLILGGAQLLHLTAYAFFTFGSVHDFGSAYHAWHVPWLAVITGYVLISGGRALSSSPVAGRRLVVAALGLTLVGIALFWPVQLLRWYRVGQSVWSPVRAASEVAAGNKAVVLWRFMQPPGHFRSWVTAPPEPNLNASLIWAYDGKDIADEVRRLYPDRQILRLRWQHSQHCSDFKCRRGVPVVTRVHDPLEP